MTGQVSAFDAEFTEEARYMCWAKSDIDSFLGKYPELTRSFNDVVNRYLVAQINKLALCFSSSDHTGNIQPAGT